MALPKDMHAVVIDKPGGPEVLSLQRCPLPTPSAHEVLIQVQAAGVNRPDLLQRMGHYPPPPGASEIPGLEVAGIVVALGQGVQKNSIGDRVCALLPGGGYAQFATADEGSVLPVPSGWSMIEAAALPETLFTVWLNVFERAFATEHESILIHGGSSGIGTMAIMLCKEFGLTVYTTAGSEEKCAACRGLGADGVIDYKTQDFVEEINHLTKGRGVDIVLDMVGGSYVGRNIACLAHNGRHVSIAAQGGVTAEINVLEIMRRRLTLTGSTLRGQPAPFKAMLASGLEEIVWPALDQGRCKPVIDQCFPLAQAAKAHERMGEGLHIGKLVLDVSAPLP